MMSPRRRLAVAFFAAIIPVLSGAPVAAQVPAPAQRPAASAPEALTYADMASLADSAPLVVHARLRKLVRVEDERMRPASPGTARFYVQAETRALITGSSPIGQAFAYLVDLPVSAKGKPLARKKDEVILFARPVPSRPGELQLVRPGAQVAWSEATEARLRTIITALLAPDAPARVTGVRELIHVPGTLAGEGETQIFLNTADSSAASVTVRHQPGQPPQWGASFSELVAELGSPPQRDTLEWYRLACALPAIAPPEANLSEGQASRAMAEADYRFVVNALGPCRRTLESRQ
ncbi:hypothetical protein [Novosphingobium sp. 9U]|uniref:hypothetical protein n=1 Tax=Novosphingobium sp. 9U TaxID=2653158 RepID=UPI0012F125BC|nr:hypothetical protein [Novosphingobium sp. 9U]VWX53592.1 conserved exported hypothetical protein [Novosphingobium sp. 9U]